MRFSSAPASTPLPHGERLSRKGDPTAYAVESLHNARTAGPVVGVPPGVTAKLQFGDDLIDGGTANAVRLIVEPWHPGMEVNMNPRLGIDPEVLNWSDSNFWRRWRFSDRLAYLEIFVAAEVAVCEYDCTGESRRARVLR